MKKIGLGDKYGAPSVGRTNNVYFFKDFDKEYLIIVK
jgi:hypothetical protein